MTRTPALAAFLLLAACSGGGKTEEEARPDPIATVRSAVATTGTAAGTATLYGTAEAGPGNERALTVQVEAIFERAVAPTGTAVRAGQVIAIMRPSPTVRADAIRTSSDALVAHLALARARRLRADGLASDADVETARAAAAAADAGRGSTSLRLATLTLRAPTTGTVQALSARPGDLVPAGTAVATIAVAGDLRARFGADPGLARRIEAGQPIRIAATGSRAALDATVTGVDPQVDPTTRLAAIYARIPAASGLGAGQSLRGTVSVEPTPRGIGDGVEIPYAALLDDGGRSYVFVIERGVARARDVSPGNSAGDRIQILSGLRPGERVVTEGGSALEDGMKVREASAPGSAK